MSSVDAFLLLNNRLNKTRKAEVTIKTLRVELPDWVWKAVRNGVGWEYLGTKDDRSVTVYPVSLLVGYFDDDCETQWRVQEGPDLSTTYVDFWLKETVATHAQV